MNRAESIAYLKRLQKQEDDALASDGGVLPSTIRDREDELGKMDPYREFERDKEKKLTSDEG
jgi:hypothetical protein